MGNGSISRIIPNMVRKTGGRVLWYHIDDKIESSGDWKSDDYERVDASGKQGKIT